MPWWIKVILAFTGVMGLFLTVVVVLVVLASKEEEPGEAEAYALEMLNDDQLQARWQEEEKSDT